MIECRGIWLPDGEEHLIPHIDKGPLVDGKGTYQLHKLEMALEHVKQFRRAVDVGAHVGLWARVLANRFDHVDAFEPIREYRECFKLNVTAPNVWLRDCALGSDYGYVTMQRYPGNSGHIHIRGSAPNGLELNLLEPDCPHVGVHLLDDFKLPDVDFLKIDAEGYELDVLKGAVETLKRCKPVIIVAAKAGQVTYAINCY